MASIDEIFVKAEIEKIEDIYLSEETKKQEEKYRKIRESEQMEVYRFDSHYHWSIEMVFKKVFDYFLVA